MADTKECGTLTGQILKNKSGEFDLESIHTLNLSKMDLSDLGCIGECTVLERLDLSFNEVTKLYALAGLTSLTDLDLTANKISSLEGLQSLDNMESLTLAGNLIGSVETLRCLSTLENLKELRLRDDSRQLSNPLCMNNSYKHDVLAVLPRLLTLDGERVAGKGCELFKLCSDLDKIIKARESQKDAALPSRAQNWVPDDYWNKQHPLEFDSSNLHDAEEQLTELLSDCRRVTSEADEKLKSIAHVQYTHSDVS